MKSSSKKIWIDLDNSPHVPFFKPIMEELKKKDFELVVTARDCFQVCGLADLMGVKCTPIGRHYGKHKIMKILGSLFRVAQLLPTVLRTPGPGGIAWLSMPTGSGNSIAYPQYHDI